MSATPCLQVAACELAAATRFRYARPLRACTCSYAIGENLGTRWCLPLTLGACTKAYLSMPGAAESMPFWSRCLGRVCPHAARLHHQARTYVLCYSVRRKLRARACSFHVLCFVLINLTCCTPYRCMPKFPFYGKKAYACAQRPGLPQACGFD